MSVQNLTFWPHFHRYSPEHHDYYPLQSNSIRYWHCTSSYAHMSEKYLKRYYDISRVSHSGLWRASIKIRKPWKNCARRNMRQTYIMFNFQNSFELKIFAVLDVCSRRTWRNCGGIPHTVQKRSTFQSFVHKYDNHFRGFSMSMRLSLEGSLLCDWPSFLLFVQYYV